MRPRDLLTAAVILLLIFRFDAYAQAGDQTYTMVLRGVPMHEALEEVARATEIDLIYSSDLAVDRTVYCDARGLAAEALLRCVLTGSGLDYVRSSTGTYVLIDALKDAPLRGDVLGRVVDARTGEPLAQANVLLADAAAGTVTNDDGLFSFSSVLMGRHRLVVTYVGYDPAVDSLRVDPGKRSVVHIGLDPSTLAMEPIVIDGLTQRLPSHGLGRPTLEGDERTVRGPFGTPDVARSAAKLPGVSMRQPLADLHIQGGDAGEHLTTLDGVPVRDPVTLGRHLSAFSPLAIDRVVIHKTGFGAEQGSHLTGVVALEHDVNPAGRLTTAVDVDPVSVSGKVQAGIPIVGGRNGSAMVSLRHSAWDLYRDPGLEALLDRWNSVDPVLAGLWIREPVTTSSLTARQHVPSLSFSDLHGAVRVEIADFHTLNASFYRATNRISSELVAMNAYDETGGNRLMLTLDDYDWTNWTAQVRNTWLVGARTVADIQLSAGNHFSHYYYRSARGDVPENVAGEDLDPYVADLRSRLGHSTSSYEQNEIRELTAAATLSRSLTPNRHVEAGILATDIDSRLRLGNHFVSSIMHDAAGWQMTAYANGRLGIGTAATMEPGLRLTMLPGRRTVYAEPRLAVRLDGARDGIGSYALRLAGGLYRQFIPSYALTSTGSTSVVPFIRFWLPIEPGAPPPRAYHVALEGFLTPRSEWTVGGEAFYKHQPYLLTLDYDRLLREHASERPRRDPVEIAQSDFISPASGRTYGGSVRIRHAGSALTATLEYAYVRAERRYPNRFGGMLVDAPWNEPHRIQAAGRYRLGSRFAVHVEAGSAWGRTWELRRAYYDYLGVGNDPVSFEPFRLDRPSSRRLPASTNLDVGVSYEADWDPLRIRVQAALVNALNRRNVYDRSLQPEADGFSTVDRTMPGRRPVLSLRLMY